MEQIPKPYYISINIMNSQKLSLLPCPDKVLSGINNRAYIIMSLVLPNFGSVVWIGLWAGIQIPDVYCCLWV